MKPLTLRNVILVLSLLFLTVACSEDTEYKQSFTLNIPITFDGEDGFSDPAGSAATADDTITPSIGVNVDMKSGNPQLVAAADGNELDELVIDAITFKVTTNSADIDIPAVDIAIGPVDIMDFNSEDAVLIGSIPAIPAGTMPEGTLQLYPENNVFAREFIFSLLFGIVTYTELSISAGDTVPSGALNIQLDFQLTMLSEGS